MSVEQVPPQVDQESVEIDDFLDNSMGGTSFLFYNGEVESLAALVLLSDLAVRHFDVFVSSITGQLQMSRTVGKYYFYPCKCSSPCVCLDCFIFCFCRPTRRKPMWTCPRHQPGGLLIRLQPQRTKRVLIIYQLAESLCELSYCEDSLNSGGYAIVLKYPTAH